MRGKAHGTETQAIAYGGKTVFVYISRYKPLNAYLVARQALNQIRFGRLRQCSDRPPQALRRADNPPKATNLTRQ